MDNEVELFWSGPVWNIPGTPWNIIGYSRACYRTGFYINHLDLLIDAGPQKSGNPKTILITHCHADHIANLPLTLIDQNTKSGANMSTIFVPEKSRVRLDNYVKAMFSVNYSIDFKGTTANYQSVKAFDNIYHKANNTYIKIEIFACSHDVPTVGYGISSKKSHLKQEYFNLKGNAKALVELKQKGIEITNTIYRPDIAFIWDTGISVLQNNPTILNYGVVMIECTFLYDDDYEQSISKKHIHWKSLKPYIIENSHITFVLVHFSLRYSESEINIFFKQQSLNNVVPWLQTFT